MDHQGQIEHMSDALALALGYERLDAFDEALGVVESCEEDSEPNDRIDALRMRLYARLDQTRKMLAICRTRLQHDAKGHRTLEIAEQLVQSGPLTYLCKPGGQIHLLLVGQKMIEHLFLPTLPEIPHHG